MICINTCAWVALDMGGVLDLVLGCSGTLHPLSFELLNMKLYKYHRSQMEPPLI